MEVFEHDIRNRQIYTPQLLLNLETQHLEILRELLLLYLADPSVHVPLLTFPLHFFVQSLVVHESVVETPEERSELTQFVSANVPGNKNKQNGESKE